MTEQREVISTDRKERGGNIDYNTFAGVPDF